MSTILLVLLILILVGALPVWPHSVSWGYFPSGGLGILLIILSVLLLTSKGAAAITGGGFITLAATLATLSGKVPVAGIVLVLAIDRFMSEARAITNLFGNAVATVFVAWWEGELDLERARRALSGVG